MLRKALFLPTIVCCTLIATGVIGKIIYDRFRLVELTLATGSEQGDYYAMGKTLSAVIPKYAPRIRIRVLKTKGARENMGLLSQKEVDLAFVQNDTPVEIGARSVAALYLEAFHLLVLPQSNIQEFSDIRGKRIAVPPEGSGAYDAFQELLRHYDIAPNQFKPIELAGNAANQAFLDKKVDGLFRIVGLGNENVRQLLKKSQGNLIPVNQAAAIQIFYPKIESTQIPKGTYNASPAVPLSDLPTAGVRSLLLAHQDIDQEVIHTLTRILYEYRSELIDLNPRAAAISFPGNGQSLGLPLHNGAKDYYDRNNPSLLQEHAEPIALLITVTTILFSFLGQIRSRAEDKQKNRADLYNLELVQVIEEANKATTLETLENLRQRLSRIFRQVIEDLDKDRLSPASYQLFVFPWEVAITTIRHRESLLAQNAYSSS